MVQELRGILKRMPFTIRVGNVPGGLSEFTDLQAAIDYVDSQTGDWVIEIHPGTYDIGDLTPSGGANITLRAIGAGRVVIAPTAAPATAVIVSGFTLTLEGITVTAPDATRPPVAVSGGTFTAFNSPLNGVGAGDAIAQTGGTVILASSPVTASIDLSTGACILAADDCDINGTLDMAGAFAHAVTMRKCNFNDFALGLAATGACNYIFIDCSGMGNITDASLLGAGILNRCDGDGSTLTKNGTSPWTVNKSFFTSVVNNNATGGITISGGYVANCGGATGSVIWWLTEGILQVIDGMNPLHTLNGLPAAGGWIKVGPGTFALTAQLARAIDNVKIICSGLATRFNLDGVTPVISAGVQDGWLIADLDTDGGGVDIASATHSSLHNVTRNGLFVTVINPDMGRTNFPGQPIMRLEEIRALNPALNPIIKLYDQYEFQAHDPVFANPYAIMRYLERQGRVVELAPTSGWTDGSTGGSVTIDPLRIICNTTAVAARDGLAYCVAAFLNSYFGAGNYDRVDWDNKIIIAFDVARILGTHADLRGRVQLKQVNTEGILAAMGIGLEIQNYALFGETFGVGRSTVNLGLTMTIQYSYRIRIEVFPGVRCDFYINDLYAGTIDTVANLPNGLAGATSYFVVSMDNAAQAVDSTLVCSPIKNWNHL